MKKVLAFWLGLHLIFLPVSAADIVLDTRHQKPGHTTLDTARNGTQVVNIARPDGSGVSHNTYRRFDVPANGVILNNANKDVKTQTAGYINGNENVKTKQASLILNEVSGTNRTYMHGYLEVAGKKADVIVANPNGITVNGGGFINIPKATLTTGKVHFSGGKPVYDVERGDVLIDGKGLNGRGSDKLEIYTKALKLNAALYANELDVVTGINSIDAYGRVSVRDASGKSRPAFSIDSTALGGIYANKIRLIGTQKGVGVRIPTEILSQGNLEISADGNIILGKVRAKKRARVRSHSRSVRIQHGIHAYKLDLSALDTLELYGNSGAVTDTTLDATLVLNYGLLAAGVTEKFDPATTGLLRIGATSVLDNHGVLYGLDGAILDTRSFTNASSGSVIASSLKINAADSANNAGEIKADSMTLTSSQVTNTGAMHTSGAMDIHADTLNNDTGVLESQGESRLYVEHVFSNRNGQIFSQKNLEMDAGSFEGENGSILSKSQAHIAIDGAMNIAGGYLEAEGLVLESKTLQAEGAVLVSYADFVLHSEQVDANGSSIQAQGNLDIIAQDYLVQNAHALLAAGGDINITTRVFDHTDDSTIQSAQDVTIQAETLNNTGSTIVADSTAIITEKTINKNGVIQGDNTLLLTTGTLENAGGTVQAGSQLHVTATSMLDNTNGVLYSGDQTTLTGGDVTNTSGYIGSGGSVSLTTESFYGDDGTISGEGVSLTTQSLRTDNTTIESTRGLDVHVQGDATLTHATLIANGTLQVQAHTTNLNGSTLYSGSDGVSVSGDAVQAGGAYFEANTTLDLHATKDLDISSSTLKGQDIHIETAKNLTGTRSVIAADNDVAVSAEDMTFRDAQISSGHDMHLDAAGTLMQDHSDFIAHHDGTIHAGEYTLTNGATLYAQRQLQTDTDQTMRIEGGSRLISEDTLTIDADTVTETNGSLYVQNIGSIHSNRFTNTEGTFSGGEITITTGTFDNTNGHVYGDSDTLNITASGAISNHGGLMTTNGTLNLHAQSLDNRQGDLEAGDTLTIEADTLQVDHSRFFAERLLRVHTRVPVIDAGTRFLSRDAMELDFAGNVIHHGEIAALGEANLTVWGDLENNGKITAGDSLRLRARNVTNNIHNTHAVIRGGYLSTLDLSGDLVNEGFLTSSGDLNITARTITNRAGIAAAFDLNIKSTNLHNYNTLYSGGNMDLYIANLLYNHTDAMIHAGGNMEIAASSTGSKTKTVKNISAQIESQGDMTISAKTLLNQGETEIDYDVYYYNTITEENMTRAQMEAWIAEREGRKDYNGVEDVLNGVKPWFISKDLYDNIVKHHGEMVHTGDDSFFGDDTVSFTADPWVEFRTVIVNKSKTTPAKITSNRDLHLNTDTLKNQDATISAARNIHANIHTLDNTPTVAHVNTSDTVNHSTWGFDDELGDNSTWQNIDYTTTSTGTTAVGGDSLIVAGGSITGTINTLQNGVRDHADVTGPDGGETISTDTGTMDATHRDVAAQDHTVDEQPVDTQSVTTTTEAPDLPEIDTAPLLPTPVTYDPVAEGAITLPNNPYELTIINKDPDGPLIETNPEYVNYDNYVSSDYMLERLDHDGGAMTRRLGDAMVETRLVRDAIIAMTGQRFIGEAHSDHEQFQILMDNGVSFALAVGLKVGKAPTAEQLKKLKKDIVWMEERTVGGKKVLVPILYLAHKYTRAKGAAIHANSMNLTVKGHLGNTGSIATRQDMRLHTGTMTNVRGEIRAGGLAHVTAIGDLKNLSGRIKGGRVQLVSHKGSIINRSLSHGVDIQRKDGKEHYTVIDKTASITATRGNLKLDAGKNIDNVGADLRAKESLTLKAKGDVNIRTVADERSYDYTYKDGKASGSSVTHQRSHITAGALVDINAGHDANLEAAKITSGMARIQAGNTVNATAVVDSTVRSSSEAHDGFLSHASRTDMTQEESAQGTTIDTGTLVMSGKKGVNLESTQITASKSASITSRDGDVSFTAKKYTNASYHEKSHEFIGGLFSRRSVDAQSKTQLADSSAEAQNHIVVKGKNVNLTATDLTTQKGNIYLTAEDKVVIQNGIESETKTKVRESSGLFQGGHLWQSKSDSTTTYDETAKKSHIRAGAGTPSEKGGSVIIDAGTADVIGSEIEAARHIVAKTDIGSITIKEAKERHTKTEDHKEKSFDLTLGVKTGNGGVGITLAKATYDKSHATEEKTTSAGSALKAGSGVQLDSAEDITVQGSRIEAGGDVNLKADGDIKIIEARDTTKHAKDTTHAEAELSIGVKNQVASAALAAKDLKDSVKGLKRAKRALDKYQKKLAQYKKDYEAGIISKEDYQEAQSDLKYYQLNVALATKNVATATKNAASAAKGVATSGLSGGFSGSVSLDVSAQKTHEEGSSTRTTASAISAGHSISVTTGSGDTSTLIRGSALVAGEGIAVDTGTLTIEASEASRSSHSSTKSAHASITVGTSGIEGASAGAGYSRSRSHDTTHTNSVLGAKHITLTSRKDTTLKGANIHSTESTTLDVGGDLRVESLQDRHSSATVGIDADVGFSKDRDAHGKQTGSTVTAGAHYNNRHGDYRSVTNQTGLTSDGTLSIHTTGNTHLKGAILDGKKGTEITTATLTTEDITNRADYHNISAGVSYTHSTTPGNAQANGIKPEISLPQNVEKNAITHTAINGNTQITLTDKAHQTQDTTRISHDTEHASYTMTEINTEVLDIRKQNSEQIAKEGFKAVGDYAMEQAAKGDKDWEDGGIKKIIAHAAVGAVAAGIGNGDAVGGAIGAGAAEAARPATQGKSDATQQWASAIIGGIAGGGTGAATGLQGEKYNRQLHQMEIKLIRDNAAAFARQKGISLAKAREMLAQAALHNVDSFYAGTKVDPDAERFIEDLARSHGGTFKDNQGRTQHLFDERANEMYNRHAVNANTIFDPEAQDLYRSTGYNPANIARSIAKSGQLQDESAATQKEFIAHAVDAAKSTGNAAYRDAAIQATVDARRNGVVDASYDTSTPVGWAMDQNLKDYGGGAAGASVHSRKSRGRGAKGGGAPESSIVTGPNGGKGVKTGHKTPDGHDIIQRESGGYYYTDPATGKQVRVNSPSTHGNTLNDTPAECYGLYCRETGEVKKIGETTHGESRYGPGNQKRYPKDYLNEHNVDYIKIDTGTKKEMHQKQHELIQEHKANNNGKRPELNKNDW